MLVIGLISGTSVDGIDAALVKIAGEPAQPQVEFVAGATYPYPPELRSLILNVCAGQPLTMAELAELDDAIASQFAQSALHLQAQYGTADLIGSHGQTVFHRPPKSQGARSQEARSQEARSQEPGAREQADPFSSTSNLSPHPSSLTPHPSLGYSLQLGRGSLIAYLTNTTTVSNFRAADIAVGGQGAPLVPPVDACLLSHPHLSRCVQNLGGIGNVTYLPATDLPATDLPATDLPANKICGSTAAKPAILGWDTGPGNALLDLAVHHFSQGALTYDQDGKWAATGVPCQALVLQWLQQPFFAQLPPKSTGREMFGVEYLHHCLSDAAAYTLSPADVLATLTELTAASIVQEYQSFLPKMPDEVYLCGGGSKNRYLRQRLQALLGQIPVKTTDDVGLNADFKEAIAFAVLAYWRLHNYPGNLPEVTGAQQSTLLGEIHLAPKFLRDRMMGTAD